MQICQVYLNIARYLKTINKKQDNQSSYEQLVNAKDLFLAKRGRRPRVAGFIILSLKGLRRDEISCGVYGHIYLSVRLVYAGNDVTRPCAGGLMV